MPLATLPIKIFADGASLEGIAECCRKDYVAGLTTNPTLMRKAGVSDYEKFARAALEIVGERPISFEVFSDEMPEMRRQALLIRRWGRNVFVKVPVTNTRGESTAGLVADLAAEGVRLNVTALLTLDQVRTVAAALNPAVPSVVSVFAGRVADTGVDPEPLMRAAKEALAPNPSAELLWASVREVFNIHQAVRCGTPIVTVTHDILAKAIQMDGRELGALSLDTVKMFRNDAVASGFSL
jgi:transaldolase